MLRKMAGAVVILGLAFGIANAETLKGMITKIDPDARTLTFKVGKDGEPKDYKVAKDCKVCQMQKGGEKEALADGLKAKQLSKIGEKGRFATIEVSNGRVTEIVLAGKKKKKDN
jgi:hypothetical protein